MALMERIQTDMVAAMKARDEARLNALRMIKAALQKHQVDTMKPLDDAGDVRRGGRRGVYLRSRC